VTTSGPSLEHIAVVSSLQVEVRDFLQEQPDDDLVTLSLGDPCSPTACSHTASSGGDP